MRRIYCIPIAIISLIFLIISNISSNWIRVDGKLLLFYFRYFFSYSIIYFFILIIFEIFEKKNLDTHRAGLWNVCNRTLFDKISIENNESSTVSFSTDSMNAFLSTTLPIDLDENLVDLTTSISVKLQQQKKLESMHRTDLSSSSPKSILRSSTSTISERLRNISRKIKNKLDNKQDDEMCFAKFMFKEGNKSTYFLSNL